MAKLLLSVILQLVGGSLFGLGLFGGREAFCVKSAAESHLKKRLNTFNLRAYEHMDAHFDKVAIEVHAACTLIATFLLWSLVSLPVWFGWIPLKASYAVSSLVLGTISFWFLHFARSKDELTSMIMQPLVGLPPLIVLISLLISMIFSFGAFVTIRNAIVLVISLEMTYFSTAFIAYIFARFTRISFLALGAIVYAVGTWLVQT